MSLEVYVERALKNCVVIVSFGVLCLGLGGCAGGAGGGDPGPIALPVGSSCQSVRAELNRLDAKGTQSRVEAASRGAKLPAAQQADVDRYNQLLNQYLGARCHV